MHFAPIHHLIGGMIIGSALNMDKRFTKPGSEKSNSLPSMLTLDSQSKWRSAFLAGFLFVTTLASSIFGLIGIFFNMSSPFEKNSEFFSGTGIIQFMIAGFMLGAGAKLAGDDLRKFAVYGVPQRNTRSLMATGMALFTAAIIATIRSDLPFLKGPNFTKIFNQFFDFSLPFLLPLIILIFNVAKNWQDHDAIKEIVKSFGIGALLGSGMLVSGLAKRHHVLNFITLNRSWDMSFIFLIIGTFAADMLFVTFVDGQKQAPTENAPSENASTENVPQSRFSIRVILGSIMVGISVGITGLYIASGILVSSVYLPQVALFFLPFIVFGKKCVSLADAALTHGKKTVKAQ